MVVGSLKKVWWLQTCLTTTYVITLSNVVFEVNYLGGGKCSSVGNNIGLVIPICGVLKKTITFVNLLLQFSDFYVLQHCWLIFLKLILIFCIVDTDLSILNSSSFIQVKISFKYFNFFVNRKD